MEGQKTGKVNLGGKNVSGTKKGRREGWQQTLCYVEPKKQRGKRRTNRKTGTRSAYTMVD